MKIYGSENMKRYLAKPPEGLAWGANVVSDFDEDYVFDALFDVPNR